MIVPSIVGGSGGGVSDHGALTGLGDDDHTQYHNDTRGDARYPQLGHSHTLSDVTDSGTAAALDVPASGDAASGEVVKGDDTRLADTRDPKVNEQTDAAAFASGDKLVIYDASETALRKIDYDDLPGSAGGEANTTSNVGAGSQLAKAKSGVDFPFRSLVAGSGISLTQNTDDVTIAASGGGGSGLTTVDKTANYTLLANEHVRVDASGASGNLTMSLVASPPDKTQQRITLVNEHATHNVDIDLNGGTLLGKKGVAEYRLCLESDTVLLEYDTNRSAWWVVYDGLQSHMCLMSRDSVQTISDAAWNKILFDNVIYDIGGIADATTNSRIDTRRAGKYQAFGKATFSLSDGDYSSFYIDVGTVLQFVGAGGVWPRAAADGATPSAMNQMLDLSAGHEEEMYAIQYSGASQNTITSLHHKPLFSMTEMR